MKTSMWSWVGIAVLTMAAALCLPQAWADPPPRTGSIEGKVLSNTGVPVDDAVVTLVDVRQRTRTAADGSFAFEAVPAGSRLLHAVSVRYGSAVTTLTVETGRLLRVSIALELSPHEEHVVVSAGSVKELSQVAQPAAVLSGEELAIRVAPTLGETLAAEPGVSSTYFGPGASRPVIRGLGGDRIRVLENGIGTGDASDVSPDHAVSTDPMTAESIEVIRGPATLLYGSTAVGGVVNVIDNRIPDHRVDAPVGGTLDLSASSAADETRGRVDLTGGLGGLGWNANYLRRDANDYRTPQGTLDNSAIESEQGGLGASWIADRGYIGVSFDRFDTLYGVPGGERIRIDMEQKRYDLRGQLDTAKGFFRTVNLRAASTDYRHVELEATNEEGTRFVNDFREGRLEATHRDLGPFRGTFGVQLTSREFAAIGEEAVVPRNATDSRALFLLEEAGPEALRFSLGARYESQDIGVEDPLLPDRAFDVLSGSAGLVWKPSDGYAVAISLARTSRPPVAEELYIDGPHPATAQFEIGDPDLSAESSLGFDIGLRKLAGRVAGEVSVYINDFGDYIFLSPTGAVDPESGLGIFAYVQDDARFTGAEAHLDIALVHRDPYHLQLELLADTVRAEVTSTGEPLPYIPPARVGVGLNYRGPRLWARLEARYVGRQDRVASYETPTADYTMVNASAGYRFFGGGAVHDILVRAKNVTDELARNHVSPLKEVAPLPGRDVGLTYRITF